MSATKPTEPLVLYLDIDGVVTTLGFQRHSGKDNLDPAQVAIVAGLVREFRAQVVVSSTWRVDDCRQTLVDAGLPAGCFHPDWRTAIPATSRDPRTGAMLPAEDAHRGEEISEHVGRNGIARYLVLDDVDVGPAHEGRHVRPSADRGLGPAEEARARSILAGLAVADRAAPVPTPSTVVRLPGA